MKYIYAVVADFKTLEKEGHDLSWAIQRLFDSGVQGEWRMTPEAKFYIRSLPHHEACIIEIERETDEEELELAYNRDPCIPHGMAAQIQAEISGAQDGTQLHFVVELTQIFGPIFESGEEERITKYTQMRASKLTDYNLLVRGLKKLEKENGTPVFDLTPSPRVPQVLRAIREAVNSPTRLKDLDE